MKVMAPSLLLSASLALSPASTHSERINFDLDWSFALGHTSDSKLDFGFASGSFSAFAKAGTNAGPIGLGFNDRAWRKVDLPHDWAIELPFEPKADLMHGYKPVGRDFPATSVGWYRKRFGVSAEDSGKRFRITFDGIFRDALVFLNGHYVGRNESGYCGATFDLTDMIKFGTENVVAVRVDASAMEGWFYEGAGIYRHVWLTRSEPVHFVEEGTSFFASVAEHGRVEVVSEVRNDGDAPTETTFRATVRDPAGIVVATSEPVSVSLPPHATVEARTVVEVPSPKRWSLESPTLYTAVAEIGTDRVEHAVGFRTFRFDPDLGFFLNDIPLRIQGTCNHQDHAGVGVAIPDRVNAYRVEQLKKFGCNFYRTSHNPPTPELLDACDRLGMLVMDEVRMFGSGPEAMSQLRRLVRRDRNHPSVIFWSIGNEEWGTQGSPESERIAKSMMDEVRRLDPSRPVTFGANNGGELKGINAVVDIRGFNYNLGDLDAYRAARPKQPIHGSEVGSTVTTRGIYRDDPARGYKKAYDHRGVDWGESAEEWWRITLERPWFAGGFVWTGLDYRGEPTPYAWPNINSHFGILDTCGFAKDVTHYYRAWWTNEPVLHVFPHWNWSGREGQAIDVWAFTNHESVELFVNGVSQGLKDVEKGGHAEWSVPYAPGKLEVKGYRNGVVVESSVVETVGPAAKLVLDVQHGSIVADGLDASVVNVRAVDAAGRPVPTASNLVHFDIEGAGRILGVGNGDPSCHEADTVVSVAPQQPVTGWRYKVVEGNPDARPEIAADYDVSGWDVVDFSDYQMRQPNTVAVFAASFEAAPDMTLLEIGPINDNGWLYLNGELIGKTTNWQISHAIDVKGRIKPGVNRLAVVVQNVGGWGGLTGDVRLAGTAVPPKFRRSLFNGLAQVIVRAGSEPGTIRLRATADGLEGAAATIQTSAPKR